MLGAIALPILISLLVTGAVLAASALAAGRRVHLLVPVALGAGYAAGHAATGWPSFPPADAVDWMAWLSIGGAAAGALGSFGSPWMGRVASAVVCAAAPVLVLRPLLSSGSEGLGAGLVAGLSALFVAGFAGLETLAARAPGASLPLVLWIEAGGTSAALLVSGSLRLAQLAGALAAALVAAAAVSVWRPTLSTARAGSLVIPVLGGLLLAGRFYSELPTASAALLALAPLAAWRAASGTVGRPEPWRSLLVRGLIALLVVSAAAAVAWSASPPIEPYEM